MNKSLHYKLKPDLISGFSYYNYETEHIIVKLVKTII